VRRLIERWRQAQAARACRRVAPELLRRYGAGPHYTAEQVGAVLRSLQLPARAHPIAFAVFLDERGFRRAVDPRIAEDYWLLRLLYRRHATRGRRGGWSGAYGGDWDGRVDGAGEAGGGGD
jgi:hypothetical protein